MNFTDVDNPVCNVTGNNRDSIKHKSKTTVAEENNPDHRREYKNKLSLVTETRKVYEITGTSSDCDHEDTEYLPSIRGESFEIKLKDDAQPVMAKERGVPFALRPRC